MTAVVAMLLTLAQAAPPDHGGTQAAPPDHGGTQAAALPITTPAQSLVATIQLPEE